MNIGSNWAVSNQGDFLVVYFGRDVMKIIEENTRKANVSNGIQSKVRDVSQARITATVDQLTGQLGHAALSCGIYGTLEHYIEARNIANDNPYVGEGPSDIIGDYIDVKTSVMRYSVNPLRYNLLVRPAERHKGIEYVLALIPQNYESTHSVILVGHINESELPVEPESTGVFAGAYVFPASRLLPIDSDFCELRKTIIQKGVNRNGRCYV